MELREKEIACYALCGMYLFGLALVVIAELIKRPLTTWEIQVATALAFGFFLVAARRANRF